MATIICEVLAPQCESTQLIRLTVSTPCHPSRRIDESLSELIELNGKYETKYSTLCRCVPYLER